MNNGEDFAKFTVLMRAPEFLSFISAPNFESPADVGGTDGDNAYVVDVQVSDGSLTDTQTITVNVQDVNAAPTITAPNGGAATASVNVDENTTAVTDVDATDDGENTNTLIYSIVNTAGTDFAKFTIDASTGVLSFISAPNFESPADVGGTDGDNAYVVDVQVSDGSLTDTQTITVNVQDVNAAPTITAPNGGAATASVNVDENTTAVTDVDATDDGENTNTLIYSIVNTAGTDFAKFTIDASTGVLSFISAPNFESPADVGGTDGDNAYVVDVQVSDGSLTDTQTITVNVQDVNAAPTITAPNGGAATASVNVDENTTAVTDVDATDDGENTNTLIYSIVNTAGTDFAKFTIDASTGVLSFISAPNFESPADVGGTDGDNAYVVDVQVSDGSLTDTQTITVNVQDVNAAPTITAPNGGAATASVNVDENTTAVTDVDATDDGENTNTLIYSIVNTAGTDFAKFTIDASTGVLSFISAPNFESPADVGGTDGDNAYVVDVQVSDGSLTDTQTITVNVQDVNAAPTITAPNGGAATASVNVDENTTAVTDVDATDDGENTNTLIYSIVNTAGTDFAKFTIDASTGVLSFISAPNFESPADVGGTDGDNAYVVDVQVSDGSLTDTQTITVNVQDVEEAPVAGGDSVITNIALGNNILIPDWALLFNDFDPEAATVSIISAVETAAEDDASHSGVTVTYVDNSPAGGSFTYVVTDGSTPDTTGTATVFQDIAGPLDGTSGDNILVSANGGATLIGGGGNDVLLGGGGNDTYRFGLSDGTDIISDAGSGGDSIEIVTSPPADSTSIGVLNFERMGIDLVIDIGTTEITVRGHYGSNSVESIVFTNGGTVYGYALSSNAYALSTDYTTPLNEEGGRDVIASASGTETLNGGTGNDLLFGNGGADTINGEAGNDLLVGGAGNDVLNGGGDADTLVGGDGADTINTGAADDNVQDLVHFNAVSEFGDTVSNFDLNGAAGVDDGIRFGGALNILLDDIINDDNFQFNGANPIGNNSDAAVDLNIAIEALFLDGSANDGVTNANLTSAAAVAAEFSAEFAITASALESTLLVVNDTDANSSALWLYTKSSGATGGAGEISAAELSLIGVFTGNGALETGNLDLVSP